uniref:CSON002390 protein n=2 Tax=Culicoides sonorensis TaxID=179676 RepID=A0A336LHW6_CULSO
MYDKTKSTLISETMYDQDLKDLYGIFQFERSQRGKPILLYDNFRFRKERSVNNIIRWRCVTKNCKDSQNKAKIISVKSLPLGATISIPYIYSTSEDIISETQSQSPRTLKKAKILTNDNIKTVEFKQKSMRKKQSESDLIALHKGCNIKVSKTKLLEIYTPHPALYTIRLAQIVFGKETLSAVSKESVGRAIDLLDQDILNSLVELEVSYTLMKINEDSYEVHKGTSGLFEFDGYSYTLEKTKGQVSYYKCASYYKNKCMGRLMKHGDGFGGLCKKQGLHNHPPLVKDKNDKKLDFQLIRSKYNTLQLKYEGHLFNQHVKRDGIIYYRCTQYAPLRCRARVTLKNNTLIHSIHEHNHHIIDKQRKYGSLKALKAKTQTSYEENAQKIEITDFEFIVGRRGSRILSVNGCRYTKNRINTAGTKTYWICSGKHIHNCNARVVSYESNGIARIINMSGEHTHSIGSNQRIRYHFITGQRGSIILVDIAGYKYVRNRVSKNMTKKYWICAKKGSYFCNARAVTIMRDGIEHLLQITGAHDHTMKKSENRKIDVVKDEPKEETQDYK